jgi:hypothetical protein
LDGGSARIKATPTHRTTQTQNKRKQIFTPLVGFELTIPGFEREKTVHVLDLAAIVIGILRDIATIKYPSNN